MPSRHTPHRHLPTPSIVQSTGSSKSSSSSSDQPQPQLKSNKSPGSVCRPFVFHQMECQYVATQRGGVALVFEGHRYNKVRDGKDGTVYWRCSRDRQCPGRAVTVNNRVKKANNKHNHPPEASLRNGLGLGAGLGLGLGNSSSNNGINANNNHTSGSTTGSSSAASAGSTGSSSAGSSHSPASHRPSFPTTGHHHHHHPLHHHLPLSLRAPNNQLPNAHIEAPNSDHRHHLRLPSSLALQEVLEAQSAAAAVSYPDIVTETLKYLAAATASGNHQHQTLAAAFASSMASISSISNSPSLKNIDRALALVSPSTPYMGHGSGGDTDYYSDSSDDQPLNMAMKSASQLVKGLRQLMKNSTSASEAIQGYIIPSCDAHQSEYIAACDNRRAFVTGFDGSSGTAIITQDDAALWTDGRYYLQAEKQLDSSWLLMKEGMPSVLSQSEWLCKTLPPGSRVGVDGFLMSYDIWKNLSKSLKASGHTLVPIDRNLVDMIWDERPPPPSAPIVPLSVKYTGWSWQEKVIDIRNEMTKKGAQALVITALDEVAYLFNLRGSDIEFNPVFFAYSVLTTDNIYLFVDDTKLTPLSRKHLQLDAPVNHQAGGLYVELRPYKMVKDFLKWLVTQEPGKIWISNKSSYALVNLIPKQRRIDAPNPVLLKKAIKNDVEVKCMRNAHIKDAVALCEFFAWLEDGVNKGQEVSELSAADKLEEFRKTQEDYIGPSFETISSSGPNAAIIHYKPSEETNRSITREEIYLCDSGGQFCDGTTDVTRTLHFGTPSKYQRECFTRVVKGHIALAMAIFPRLTKGQMLDTLARMPLWEAGLDYCHGTGHGVGMYLNVHEGPMGISYKQMPDDPGFDEGMILSNEPGYYEDGSFGIRIESLVLVKKADTKYNFRDRGFLTFDTITLVPIQTKLLDPTMLTGEEIEWLDNYHQLCREVIGKALDDQGRSKGLAWLMKETQSLG